MSSYHTQRLREDVASNVLTSFKLQYIYNRKYSVKYKRTDVLSLWHQQ